MNDIKNKIVIGTSPISLIKAIILNLLNEPVSIIEKSSQIGGCWQFGADQNFNYDLGCHYLVPFQNDEKNLQVVKELSKLGISSEIGVFSALFDRKIDELSDYSEDQRYIKIKGGYASITNTLNNTIKKMNIPIYHDTVEAVLVDKNKVELLGKISNYYAEKLFIPSYFDIKNIKINEIILELEQSYQDSQHLTFLVNGSWNKKYYNYYFINESKDNPFDKLSFYRSDNGDLFNIRIGRNNKSKKDDDLFRLGINFINKLGYNITKIYVTKRHIYEFPFRSEKNVRELQKKLYFCSNGKINMLYTRNFTQALLELYQ